MISIGLDNEIISRISSLSLEKIEEIRKSLSKASEI